MISAGDNQSNFADSYLLPGSLVKPIIAYAGLQSLENVGGLIYNGVTFFDYLKNSDDNYSAELFKRLMTNPLELNGSIGLV